MPLHRRICLAAVAILAACSSSTGPSSSTSKTTALSVPTGGGTIALPAAGGYSPTLQIGSGAPAGVTITAAASTTAPASASVAARGRLHARVLGSAVPILYETLTFSGAIAAQYFLSETFQTSSAPAAAGALYFVSIVDATTDTSLGDFSQANPGGITSSVTVQNTYYTITGAPTISFNPGDAYVFEFYYLPLTSVSVFARSHVVGIGDTLGLQLDAIYPDTILPVQVQGTWSSSNTSVATIDASTGVVTGVSGGTVVMTGTFAGMSGVDTLTVTSGGGFTVTTVSATGTDTVDIPFSTGGSGAFAVLAGNTGATSTGLVTVSTSTGGVTLPLTATICQTTDVGQCMSTPTSTVAVTFTPGASATFGVFLTASAAIPTRPTLSVLFTNAANQVLGTGSVIIKTQ